MPAVLDHTTVAGELLSLLREREGFGGATYAEPPAAITGGYDTATFSFRLNGAAAPWDRALILRLFRPENFDAPRIESAIQNAVASLGYPCPRALLAGGDDTLAGRPYMVMERVEGRPLITYITTPSRMTLRATPILARAHARLHAMDAGACRDLLLHQGFAERDLHRMSFEAEFADVEAVIQGLHVEPLGQALQWLANHRPPPAPTVLCHGDFHPVNVMLDADGRYAVIDWTLARFGEPEYDIARTVILWRRAPIDRMLVSGPRRLLIDIGRRSVLWRYKRLYAGVRGIDAERLRWYEAFDAVRVVALTLAGRNTTLWRQQPVIDGLIEHVRQRTGLALGAVPLTR